MFTTQEKLPLDAPTEFSEQKLYALQMQNAERNKTCTPDVRPAEANDFERLTLSKKYNIEKVYCTEKREVQTAGRKC